MADIKWTWNFDVYDESDSPTEEGYYRIIDDEGNETTDYYFNEPRLTPNGIGYWRDGTRPIIAWRRIAEQTEPSTECKMCKHFKHRPNCGWECEYDTFEECNYEPKTEPSNSEIPNNCKDEPQTCEECEHWNDTEDGCADRHGCKIEPQTERSK